MNANEIRVKNVIRVEDKLFRVVDIEHVKPGKGHAYIVLSVKNMMNDHHQTLRYRTTDKLEDVMIIEKEVVYLYNEDQTFFFLDEEGNEISIIGERVPYKQLIIAGMKYKILYAEDEIISVSLPDEMEVEVESAPSFITGQSATSQNKTIRTTNGLEIHDVPQYVKKGDVLKINSELKFIKRV